MGLKEQDVWFQTSIMTHSCVFWFCVRINVSVSPPRRQIKSKKEFILSNNKIDKTFLSCKQVCLKTP